MTDHVQVGLLPEGAAGAVAAAGAQIVGDGSVSGCRGNHTHKYGTDWDENGAHTHTHLQFVSLSL